MILFLVILCVLNFAYTFSVEQNQKEYETEHAEAHIKSYMENTQLFLKTYIKPLRFKTDRATTLINEHLGLTNEEESEE